MPVYLINHTGYRQRLNDRCTFLVLPPSLRGERPQSTLPLLKSNTKYETNETTSPPPSSLIMLSSSPANLQSLRLGFRPALTRPSAPRPAISAAAFRPPFLLKPSGLGFSGLLCDGRRCFLPVAAIEESAPHGVSDGEVEKNSEIELQTSKDPLKTSASSVKQHAPKYAAFREWRRRRRTRPGVMINMALIAVLISFLLFFDWCSWRIVRLSLGPFYFTRPFLISAVLSACAGWLYVPIVDSMNIHQVLREEGPTAHYIKKGTPTMGGIFFIPIGIAVAIGITGQSSIPLYRAAVGTLAYAAIGLTDDLLSCVKGHNYGLPGWIKLSLQVAVGILFAFWLDSANITTTYKMKLFVPLPGTLGLVHLGKSYLVLTAFCFAAMGNGVNLTDGLDGLAGGVAAWAFIAMSVTVLAICPDLAIFGVSMAGACVGFLFHNRYKASVFMGDTGSLALGGALAAMASCTGMFIPLFITSGVFVMEALSVIVQVSYVKATRWLYGESKRFFRMAPVHHHFELCGFKEPIIVASAYFMSCIFALCAAYVGLISA